jgi:hypothetical protein
MAMSGGMDMQSGSSSGSYRGGTGGMGGQSTQAALVEIRQRTGMEPVLTVRRFDFVIQFAWVETPPSQRKLKNEGGALIGADTSK